MQIAGSQILYLTEDLMRDALACCGIETSGLDRAGLIAAWNAEADKAEARFAAELSRTIDLMGEAGRMMASPAGA